MNDIVIVNPSANMQMVASELRSYGNNVIPVRTSDMPQVAAARVFYFFAGYNACFTTEAQGEVEKEDRVFLFKHGFLTRFRMMGISKVLGQMNPELTNGNFVDLLMFKRGMLKYEPNVSDEPVFPDIQSVSSVYPGARLLTAAVPGQGGLKISYWETDFDLKETFGSDYFVFFSERAKVEAFVVDDKLVTVAKDKNAIDQLAKVNPTFSKFSFELVHEKPILKNPSPWVVNVQTPQLSLINDYSYFNTSVSMQALWYDKLANYINFQKP